jgi:hypothetical protein
MTALSLIPFGPPIEIPRAAANNGQQHPPLVRPMNGRTYRPQWLKNQVGLRYHAERAKLNSRYMSKFKIITRFAKELEKKGLRVTHRDIRAMLRYLKRGYRTDAQSISHLSYGFRRGDEQEKKYSNGHRVEVICGDERKVYRSLGDAARNERCSPESVRKWALSSKRTDAVRLGTMSILHDRAHSRCLYMGASCECVEVGLVVPDQPPVHDMVFWPLDAMAPVLKRPGPGAEIMGGLLRIHPWRDALPLVS